MASPAAVGRVRVSGSRRYTLSSQAKDEGLEGGSRTASKAKAKAKAKGKGRCKSKSRHTDINLGRKLSLSMGLP